MNNCSIPSMHAERKITDLSVKHSFTLHPSLCPYGRRESLTEEQIHSLRMAGGSESHFVVLKKFIRDLNNTVLVKISLVFYILICMYYVK